MKRKIVTASELSLQSQGENRTVKIVRVNPSISIQPKKPTAATLITTSNAMSASPKPGFVVRSSQPTSSNVTKTIVVTSSAEALKKQLEESQKMVEQFREQLRKQEQENARLKRLLETSDASS